MSDKDAGEAAAMYAHECGRLRKDNKRLRKALEGIIDWKKSSMDYDDDMGHNQRIYCEDVDLIIEFAKQSLKGADNDCLSV